MVEGDVKSDGDVMCEGGSSDSEKTLELPGRGDMEPQPNLASPQTDEDSDSSVQDLRTPERTCDGGWREELFTTPQFGNSGPRHEDIMEMCVGLMQYFGTTHPHIAKFLICH